MKGKFDFKKLWKRNQIMITALALMIAIAGYLNFTGKQIDDEILFTTSAQFEEADASVVEETTGLYDISMEDVEYYTEIESLDEDITVSDAETVEDELAVNDVDLNAGADMSADADLVVEENLGADAKDVVFNDEAVLETGADSIAVAQVEEGEIPGEAVFTNTMSVTSLAEANLLKEQTRATNKQALLDIINNENISEAAKQEAVNSMIALTDLAQKETETLIMLEAKGFADAVVSINGETVDVCIGMNELTQPQIAQIEDIVKRKTGVPAENIIISPVGGN